MYEDKEALVIGGFLALLVGIIIWLCFMISNWGDKCEDMGGSVKSEYMYSDSNGQPVYDYTCVKDGVEINVD